MYIPAEQPIVLQKFYCFLPALAACHRWYIACTQSLIYAKFCWDLAYFRELATIPCKCG